MQQRSQPQLKSENFAYPSCYMFGEVVSICVALHVSGPLNDNGWSSARFVPICIAVLQITMGYNRSDQPMTDRGHILTFNVYGWYTETQVMRRARWFPSHYHSSRYVQQARL